MLENAGDVPNSKQSTLKRIIIRRRTTSRRRRTTTSRRRRRRSYYVFQGLGWEKGEGQEEIDHEKPILHSSNRISRSNLASLNQIRCGTEG